MNYEFYWPVILEYRQRLLSGLWVTLQLSVLTFLVSVPLASVIGVARMSRRRFIRGFSGCYVELFRNIPLVVQLFYWYFGVGLDAFAASVVGLVLYSSAYMGETVRAGIQSIRRTQYDAAYSTGLNNWQVVRHVVLPQAAMIVIPPLGTELINVIKSSAIAMTITVQELTFQTQEIDALTYRGFEASTVATVIYLALALIIVGTLNMIERLVNIETKVL